MFHHQRDHGAAADSSDPSSTASSSSRPVWPSHFRRSAQHPADPFPVRKSSDQVIQQLRDELDKQRQMFFDRLPTQWEDSPSSHRAAGFPFGTSRRPAASAFQHEDSIPAWMMDDDMMGGYPSPFASSYSNRQRWPSGGSGRSAGSNASSHSSSGGGGNHPEAQASHQQPNAGPPPHPAGTTRCDSPGNASRAGPQRMHKPAARSATGDFPPAGSSPAAAFCRASSAPPVGPHQQAEEVAAGSPSSRRTFTTTVHHTPMRPSEHLEQPTTHSPGPNRRKAPPSSSGGPTVRHIPIMVEGRDEPVLPSVDEEDAAAKERRSKTAIPMPFYPMKSSVLQPPSGNKVGQTVVDGREKSPQGADSSVPIPLPYDRLSDVSDSSRSVGSNMSTESGSAVSAELELIGRIQKETETLLPRIEAFQGDRNDRGFLFLDEMLTRLLLKLDDVQVGGREDIRLARREAITSITRCINLLESKILGGIDRDSNSQTTGDEAAPKAAVDGESAVSEAAHDAPTAPAEAPIAPAEAPAAPVEERHVSQLVINLKPSPEKDQVTTTTKPMTETQL